MKVLFVDTYGTMGKLIEEYLHRLGHEPVIAETDTRAIGLARDGSVDAAVVNFKRALNQRNGYRLILELKKIRPDLKIMVLTGFSPTLVNECSSPEFRQLCEDFERLEALGVPICRKEGLNLESFSTALEPAKSQIDIIDQKIKDILLDAQSRIAADLMRPSIV